MEKEKIMQTENIEENKIDILEEDKEFNEILENANPFELLNQMKNMESDANDAMQEKQKEDIVITSLLGNGSNLSLKEAKNEVKRIKENLKSCNPSSVEKMNDHEIKHLLGFYLDKGIDNIMSEAEPNRKDEFKKDLLKHLIENEKLDENYNIVSTNIQSSIQQMQKQLFSSVAVFDDLEEYEKLIKEISEEKDEEKRKELEKKATVFNTILLGEKLVTRILNKSVYQYKKESRQYQKVYATALKKMKRAKTVTYIRDDGALKYIETIFEEEKVEAKIFLLALWREIIRNNEDKDMAMLESQLIINLTNLYLDKKVYKDKNVTNSLMYTKLKELLKKIK